MAYQNTIPAPTYELKTSQNDLLNNFQSIQTAWDINHITFDLADQGKHKQLSLPEQAAGPVTAANELALYSKESALTAVAELFVRKESSGAEIEFTSSTSATPGWTRLPSGILLKWGATTANGATNILFPVAGTVPVFNNVYSVQLTVVDAAGADADEAIRLVAFAVTDFDAWASPRSTTGTKAVNFEYFAIGD